MSREDERATDGAAKANKKRRISHHGSVIPAEPTQSPAVIASSLKTTSPDALKTALNSLSQATKVRIFAVPQEVLPAGDSRLTFAREFLAKYKGRDRLFEAWERIHDVSIPWLAQIT